MANPVHRIKSYYHDVMLEAKKCTWPPMKSLREQTIMVIAAMFLLTGFILAVDKVLQFLIRELVL
jgi:preprotein translocase SecE subunit